MQQFANCRIVRPRGGVTFVGEGVRGLGGSLLWSNQWFRWNVGGGIFGVRFYGMVGYGGGVFRRGD